MLPYTAKESSINSQIAWATQSRLFLNTARRFAYPFAAVLSRGLGVPLSAIGAMIAALQGINVLGGFIGPLGDKFGYRAMMLAGLGLLSFGMFLGAIFPVYVAVFIGILLASLGKSIFDPALQAYVGQHIPAYRRGRVIGIVEMSWAGSTLIGIPIVSLLIKWQGWRAPFWALGIIGLISMGVMWRVMPVGKSSEHSTSNATGHFKHVWTMMLKSKTARAALTFAFFTNMANDVIFVSYALWLESRFSLGVVALGMATAVIGIAELLGEGFTASFADRIGLRRVVLIAVFSTTLAYAVLPLMGMSLPIALTALFFTFLSFETGYVTSLSIFTEILPSARGTMMASIQGIAGAGRMIGALAGSAAWLAGGNFGIAMIAGTLSAIAFGVLAWGLSQRK